MSMNNNSFTDSQLNYIYSDKDFLLFLSSYFSTYNVTEISLNGDLSQEKVDDFWKIFIRILLANVNDVLAAIEKIEKNISFSYEEKKVKTSDGIKGRLIINEYVKNKSMVRLPREYPCVVKEKTYSTVENEYLAFIVNDISQKLQELINVALSAGVVKGQETEITLLNEKLDYFMAIVKKHPFKALISRNLIRDNQNGFAINKIKLIQTRFVKGKIRNDFAYKRVFNWYEYFKNGGFTWVNSSNLKTLVYDDSFCNKLFEIWNLYRISEVFQQDFGMELIVQNVLVPGMKDFVYKLRNIDGSNVEIYYQKGADLYWDTELRQNWRYIQDGMSRELIGIPDISIKYIGDRENITIIDLKNRIRKAGGNSEEIYKIIGYFSNFNRYLSEKYSTEYKNQAVLIFRNDTTEFEECLESDTGEQILSISTGISETAALNHDQFVKICRYVLNVQGVTGTKSETISKCNKSIDFYRNELEKALENSNDVDIENIIYEIEMRNHSIITNMFSIGDLQDTLTKKKNELKVNHFPHVWDCINNTTIDALAMADCLFSGLAPCDLADYAPVCLEYCRALEIQLNELLFTPFKNQADIRELANKNWNYEKLINDRDLTLGECIFLFEKCQARNYPTIELLDFLKDQIPYCNKFLDIGINILKQLNIDIRRKAAHTTIMSYDELLDARQRVLGIGNINIMYLLFDDRTYGKGVVI